MGIKKILREEIEEFDLGPLFEAEFDPLGHVGDEPIESDDLDELGVDLTKDCVLGFPTTNAKLEWPYFSLPAGYTCPFATVCKNFPAKWEGPVKGGKFNKPASWEKNIKPGPKAKHMCYAARAQGQYPASNIMAFKNLNLLKQFKTSEGMANLIVRSMRYHNIDNTDILRIHEAGDFFSQTYFDAWIEVAKKLPGTLFYAYTLSLPFWLARQGQIPSNFKLIASLNEDNEQEIIDKGLRYSRMVNSLEEAKALGLPVDVDDSIAWGSDESFALILHGPQPKGSDAALALKQNKEAGVYGKEGLIGKAKQRNQAKKDALRQKIRTQLRKESVNEGWWSKTREDKIALDILERVKRNLPENLEGENGRYSRSHTIKFTLDERIRVSITGSWSFDSSSYRMSVNNNNLEASRWAIRKLYKYVDKKLDEKTRERNTTQIEVDLIDPNYAEDVFDRLDDINEDLEYWGMDGNQLGPLDEEDDDLQWIKDVPEVKVGDIFQVRGYEDMGEQGQFEILNVAEEWSGYNVRNIKTMRNQFITIDLANRYLINGEWYKIG